MFLCRGRKGLLLNKLRVANVQKFGLTTKDRIVSVICECKLCGLCAFSFSLRLNLPHVPQLLLEGIADALRPLNGHLCFFAGKQAAHRVFKGFQPQAKVLRFER